MWYFISPNLGSFTRINTLYHFLFSDTATNISKVNKKLVDVSQKKVHYKANRRPLASWPERNQNSLHETHLCLADWTLPTEDGRWLIDTGWPRAARLKWRRQIKGSLKISGEHLHLHRVAAIGKTNKTTFLPRFGGNRSGIAGHTYGGTLVKMKIFPADF